MAGIELQLRCVLVRQEVLQPAAEVWAGAAAVIKGQANQLHHCRLKTLQRKAASFLKCVLRSQDQ